MWMFILGSLLIAKAAFDLAPYPGWQDAPVQLLIGGLANTGNNANTMLAHINQGRFVLIQAIDFTLVDLGMLYFLASSAPMFNVGNVAHMFPFQTIDWPSVPITLVYVDQQVVPPPPPAVRPNGAELSAFMYRFASRRGKYDDPV